MCGLECSVELKERAREVWALSGVVGGADDGGDGTNLFLKDGADGVSLAVLILGAAATNSSPGAISGVRL